VFVDTIKSSHLYLFSALYNTEFFKAALQENDDSMMQTEFNFAVKQFWKDISKQSLFSYCYLVQ